MSDKKPSLSIAFGIQSKNKKKKMAEGGKVYSREPAVPMAKPDDKRLNKEDYMGDEWAGGPDVGAPPTNWGPDKKEYMASKFAEGGQIPCAHCQGSGHFMESDMPEEGHDSIAEKILASRKFAKGGEISDLDENDMEGPGTNMEPNVEAKDFNAEHGVDDYSGQPEDSNEHSVDLEDEDSHDMVESIRKKLKSQRG